MKWSLIQPERDRYDWAGADELVNFAIAHEMKVRGHTLIWQQQMPDWLKYGDWTFESRAPQPQNNWNSKPRTTRIS